MPEFDLVIRGGTIVDGTGIPRYRADLGIKDGKVAMISGKINAAGSKELDASGCIVAPGAIDLHTTMMPNSTGTHMRLCQAGLGLLL